MTKRLEADDRRDQILTAALREAEQCGYMRITRQQVAEAAGCANGLVSVYFGTMTQLRRAVIRAAINRRNLKVVLQGIVADDPHAIKAPQELKQAAIRQAAEQHAAQ
jgi:AcrR family transcriptional regulator